MTTRALSGRSSPHLRAPASTSLPSSARGSCWPRPKSTPGWSRHSTMTSWMWVVRSSPTLSPAWRKISLWQWRSTTRHRPWRSDRHCCSHTRTWTSCWGAVTAFCSGRGSGMRGDGLRVMPQLAITSGKRGHRCPRGGLWRHRHENFPKLTRNFRFWTIMPISTGTDS